jgi:hypothetical protein
MLTIQQQNQNSYEQLVLWYQDVLERVHSCKSNGKTADHTYWLNESHRIWRILSDYRTMKPSVSGYVTQ